MTGEKEEILYFKTEKERMAYLRNRVTIEPIEYVEEPKEEETVKVVQTEEEQPKKKRGKKKNVAKEVQTD